MSATKGTTSRDKSVRSGALDTRARVEAGLARRYRKERRFRSYGLLSVAMGLLFLGFLFATIIGNGYSAFWQTKVRLEISLDPEVIDPAGGRERQALSSANYTRLVRNALQEIFPDVEDRRSRRSLSALISQGASFDLRERVMEDPDLIGQTIEIWVSADDEVDMVVKGHAGQGEDGAVGRLTEQQLGWIEKMRNDGLVEKRFNTAFFTSGDSREPELAGIWGATKGSFFMLVVTLALSFPLGVAAAIYLEEFAPKNRWVDIIEVNINNLAAVPSIVFGLLGLAMFINLMGLPRSAPLVGGLVLTLMTLPTVIIASRAAVKSVPPSVREAALGIGASQMQTVFHHVLPLALPGMLTGAIIGMARALGESAPLLMIGMVAFIVEVPGSPMDPSTALPGQGYLWADSPERAFAERTSAAIIV
ncbi:MAG: phosphate ABC transporter permease PstA, partial [Gammaproteobacteria bacterium]